MGKSTISMAMASIAFCNKLPEGTRLNWMRSARKWQSNGARASRAHHHFHNKIPLSSPIPSHYTIWLIGFPTMGLSSSPGNQLAQVPIANQPGYFYSNGSFLISVSAATVQPRSQSPGLVVTWRLFEEVGTMGTHETSMNPVRQFGAAK